MPRLPDAEQLGLRVPEDRSNVVVGNFDYSGTAALGRSITDFASGVKNRQDMMNLQKARTVFAKRKLEADNAFDQDNDYETFVDRYNESLGKAEEEALSLISNPRMKELFKLDADLTRAQGVESMKDFAFKKETESGLATLQDIISTNREIALNAKNETDRAGAFDTMNDAIETARLNTYIDADAAQGMRQKVAVDAAIGTIKVQDYKTQVDWLTKGEGPAELIPTDTRKVMLEQAKNQLVNQEGMVIADQVRAEGGSLTDRIEKVKQVEDVDIRAAAQRQVEHDYSLEKTGRLEKQAEYYDMGRKALNAGQSINQWMAQNPDEWAAMSGDQQASLISSQNKAKMKTDRTAYVEFMERAREDTNDARDFLYQNAHKFDDGDFEKFVGMVTKPKEVDGFLTRSQRLSVRLGEAGIEKDDDEYVRAMKALEDDYTQFQQQNKKEPNAKELDAMMDGIFDKVVDTAWYNPFSSDVYGYDLPQGDRNNRANERMLAKFEEIMKQVEAELSGNSDIPVIITDEQRAQYYINAERAGLLDE